MPCALELTSRYLYLGSTLHWRLGRVEDLKAENSLVFASCLCPKKQAMGSHFPIIACTSRRGLHNELPSLFVPSSASLAYSRDYSSPCLRKPAPDLCPSLFDPNDLSYSALSQPCPVPTTPATATASHREAWSSNMMIFQEGSTSVGPW